MKPSERISEDPQRKKKYFHHNAKDLFAFLTVLTTICTDGTKVVKNKINDVLSHIRASQVARVVTDPPVNAGDVRDVGLILGSGRSPGGGRCNPILVWRIPWTEGPDGL